MAVWVECTTTKWPLRDTISCRFGGDKYLITGAGYVKSGIETRSTHVRRLYETLIILSTITDTKAS
jgi:hypothetical protein